MKEIRLLSKETIDQIAAGEVVERPSSVVKELVENSIDAGSNAVTVEIRDGGLSMIRVTDNGEGIDRSQIHAAFVRHATSKITDAGDLAGVRSLGFRGEALASISAVSQVELITKRSGDITGVRFTIEGGEDGTLEEIGAPQGSTFIIRNLFYNTPARKKFLKSAVTEGGYIGDMLEHLALSRPDISFKFITNGQVKLHTAGNGSLRDVIYHVYGREIAAALLPVELKDETLELTGFIGKPEVSRGNRNFESYFVGGRFVKSRVVMKAIEDGYGNHLMQHRYPFTVLCIDIPAGGVDVNVHPSKQEVRFADNAQVYEKIMAAVRETLAGKELIPGAVPGSEREQRAERRKEIETLLRQSAKAPEPFEKVRRDLFKRGDSPYAPKYDHRGRGQGQRAGQERPQDFSGLPWHELGNQQADRQKQAAANGEGGANRESGIRDDDRLWSEGNNAAPRVAEEEKPYITGAGESADTPPQQSLSGESADISRQQSTSADLGTPQQQSLFDDRLLSPQNVQEHRLIGQVFGTYWIIEFRDSMYIVDQHAAHEKVIYERMVKAMEQKRQTSQQISPPIIVSMTPQEEELFKRYSDCFTQVGFEVEPFGGKEYAIRAVPDNLYGFTDEELFTQMLDSLSETSGAPGMDFVFEKLAGMACKAAIKGNHRYSVQEANALIGELLGLENPYNCPHGRPTIIAMSRYEMERKFKRIVG